MMKFDGSSVTLTNDPRFVISNVRFKGIFDESDSFLLDESAFSFAVDEDEFATIKLHLLELRAALMP